MVDLSFFKFWAKVDANEFEEQQKFGGESISTPKKDDGAIEIETPEGQTSYNAMFQQFFTQETQIKSTKELINTYRTLMGNPEVENAVAQIVNDAIVYEKGHKVMTLDLDDTSFSENLRNKIYEEFDTVCKLLNTSRQADTLFRRWYVDSRLFFHKIIKDPKKGIMELRRLDPRNIEYYREVITGDENGTKVVKGYKEFFVYTVGNESYNYNGTVFAPNSRIKIPRAAIVYAHSGETDCNDKNIIGYLHRAVKPANQLKLLEDALVIYRITRAPERRVFYIDVGNMNGRKASQYVNGIMNNFKNRVVYDSNTGTIKNQQHNLSMTEDYWLMRRDGKSVTQVDTLPGAQTMGDMEDVRWFNKKLYEALRIPLSRMPKDDGGVIIGGAGNEITRDELDFAKFINNLQHQFEEVVLDPLRTNIVLKKILTEQEWDAEINNIKVNFHKDSYYSELKEAEIYERRINMLQLIEPYVGRYVSHDYVMKNILQMTDEQIEIEAKLIEDESDIERFKTELTDEEF